jgi:hypothetical protein
VPALEAPVAQSSPVLGNDEFAGIVEECIRQTLLLYGRGRGQYHGFLWCNYEHEQGKGWTFPVEGDFNCHLYHRLRGSLPPSVEIVAEYHPPGLEEHLDLFLSCDSPKATAAIEVKMNWDQFKPKYHKGVLRRTEADTILHKFGHCAADGHTNYLVVIQGMDAHKSDHREKALSVLSASPVALHLLSYDERNEKSEKHTLARSAGIRGQPIKTGTIESAGDIVVPSTCAGSPRVDGIDGVTCSGLGSGESLTEPGQQARAEVLTMPESKTGRAAMPQGTDFSDMIARVEQAHLSRFVTDLRNHLPCDCVVSRSKDMWVVKLSGKIVFELHPRADHLLCAIRKPRVCDKKDIAPCGELQSDRSQTESHPYISFKIKTMEHLENAKALLVRLVDRER